VTTVPPLPPGPPAPPAPPPAPASAPGLPPSAFVLLLANTVPLFGVLLHQWTVFAVMLLYWSENVVVGGFNILRMLFARPSDAVAQATKVFLIPFFCVHYGMFTFVHGVFVFGLFGKEYAPRGFGLSLPVVMNAIHREGLGWAIVALCASHAFSFFHNYLAGGEYRNVALQQLMMRPYGRIVLLHLTIIFGGMLVMALGSPVAALVLLVTLKTAIDLGAHMVERKKLGAPAFPASAA